LDFLARIPAHIDSRFVQSAAPVTSPPAARNKNGKFRPNGCVPALAAPQSRRRSVPPATRSRNSR